MAWSLAAGVGAARLYVGAHLPLDISGGAGLGYAVAAAVHLLFGSPASPPGGPATVRAEEGRLPGRWSRRRAEKAHPNPTRAAPFGTYSTPRLGAGSI
ncbi:MAG: phosphatase PAP2 family protein [Actinobacteria bacterium]|nr:phosphatase PAP2 family protein [Actinomycetota bacterium]